VREREMYSIIVTERMNSFRQLCSSLLRYNIIADMTGGC
jgi:hypothetical protein